MLSILVALSAADETEIIEEDAVLLLAEGGGHVDKEVILSFVEGAPSKNADPAAIIIIIAGSAPSPVQFLVTWFLFVEAEDRNG